ncbi:tRNA (34-2'-O)-methyltransferase regulator WDR6-like isoform X2 [Ciona intestinalis]
MYFIFSTFYSIWGAAHSIDELILCAGTVFNQIVVWKPCVGGGLVEIMERVVGHDGVIFHISYDHKTHLLTSASDDRSIRIWKCSSLLHTIYGGTTTATQCMCVMYGHEARVWNVLSITRDTENYLISISEDGLAIIWALNLHNSSIKAEVVKKINCRGNLLSLAANGDKFIVGGADGGIRLFHLNKCLLQHFIKQVNLPDNDNLGVPKTVKLLTHHQVSVLVHTSMGALMHYNINQSKWSVLHTDINYGSYSMMDVNQTEKYIGVGNTKGSVKILALDKNYDVVKHVELNLFQSKVYNLSWSGDNVFLSGENGRLVWLRVTSEKQELVVTPHCEFILPPAKHRWHVDVLIIHPYIVCGDRRGSLHLFHEDTPHPTTTIHGVHGKYGSTSLTLYDDSIISTGRDGYWRKSKLVDGELVLETKHRASQGMDWIEGCNVLDGNKLFFHGFRGNKFVAWSKYSGDDVFSVLCGGCHRSWGFSVKHSKFVFLKAGTINIVEIPYEVKTESMVSSSLHNQQITCVKFLGRVESSHGITSYIVTGADDTKVIISAIVRSESTTKLEVLQILDDHSSNVRSLAVLPVKENDLYLETLLFTAGGRATLNVYSVQLMKTSVKCLVKQVASFEGEKSSSDMRYMAVVGWKDKSGETKVSLACSDGRLRVAQIQQNTINISSSSREYEHCFLTLTYINQLIIAGSTNGKLYFMTSSMEELLTHKCHQSGINAIASCEMKMESSNYLLVVSGGDDNALHFLLLHSRENTLVHVSECCVKSAHATQITGVYINITNHVIFIVTVSIDQRIIKWRLVVSDDLTMKCNKEDCDITHVADVSGMDMVDDEIVISGRGLLHGISVANYCSVR